MSDFLDDVYWQWGALCARQVGRPLEINFIDIDGCRGVIGHQVDNNQPPIISEVGPVRIIILSYDFKEVQQDPSMWS